MGRGTLIWGPARISGSQDIERIAAMSAARIFVCGKMVAVVGYSDAHTVLMSFTKVL